LAQEAELKFWKSYLGMIPQDREQFVAGQLQRGQERLSQFDLDGIEGRLLDVGSSAVSMHEGRENLEVVAVDPLLDAFCEAVPTFARQGQVGNTEYRCCEVYDVQDGPFDVIWCVNVLDHTDDWKAMIGEFARLTRRGGLLLIGVDVRCGVELDSSCHISAIGPQELVDVIWDAGFVVEFHAPTAITKKQFYFCVRATRR